MLLQQPPCCVVVVTAFPVLQAAVGWCPALLTHALCFSFQFPITALREIKILQLLKHENVVNLIEICRTKGSCWGSPLRRLLAEGLPVFLQPQLVAEQSGVPRVGTGLPAGPRGDSTPVFESCL